MGPTEPEQLDGLYRTVYRRALYLTGDPTAAEDAAQETFARYVAQRPAGLRTPAAWLVQVVTRLCIDGMRRRRRGPELRAELPEVPDAAPLPDEVLQRQDEAARIRQALDRLEPRDRQILLMRHASASYREIAAAVGCAENSVGQLLHRAERRLKVAYEALDRPSR